MRRAPFLCMLVLVTSLTSLSACADLVVVVNRQSGIDQLTRTQVINIFLGNHREYPNGLLARPVDQATNSPEKAEFYRVLVNKDLDQMAAYWARLVFAGNTAPPLSMPRIQDLLQLVETDRSAIAYVDRKRADASGVKVVFSLP